MSKAGDAHYSVIVQSTLDIPTTRKKRFKPFKKYGQLDYLGRLLH